jgi:hypothetical protein
VAYHRKWYLVSGVLAVLAAAGVKPNVSITVTCAFTDTGQPFPDDGHTAGYSQFNIHGSRSPTGYTDNIGASRVVAECVLYSSTALTQFVFGIDGTSVPNVNGTFRSIVVNGTVLQRSAATYDSSENSDSWWTWSTGLPTVPDSGLITLTIRF